LAKSDSTGDNRRMDSTLLDGVRKHIATQVIGQRELVDSMLICLVSSGHVLEQVDTERSEPAPF